MQQLVIEAISDKDDFSLTFLAITSKCLSDGKTQDNPDLDPYLVPNSFGLTKR